MAGRWVRSVFTVWKRSTTPSYLILSSTMLRVMKTPVLPTPALRSTHKSLYYIDSLRRLSSLTFIFKTKQLYFCKSFQVALNKEASGMQFDKNALREDPTWAESPCQCCPYNVLHMYSYRYSFIFLHSEVKQYLHICKYCKYVNILSNPFILMMVD